MAAAVVKEEEDGEDGREEAEDVKNKKLGEEEWG